MPEKRSWHDTAPSSDYVAYTPHHTGAQTPKRFASKPVASYAQANTLRLIRQAQLDMARNSIQRRPVPETLSCDDCARVLEGDFICEAEYTCKHCGRNICRYCSVQRDNSAETLECLECLR